jgi:pantothenate kinase
VYVNVGTRTYIGPRSTGIYFPPRLVENTNKILNHFITGKTLPWVGIDIGGTLAKVAYFEYYENGDNMKYLGNNHTAVLDFIKSTHQYGPNGERDARLELKDVQLGRRKGTLHFIRFPTSRMDEFLELPEEIKAKEFLQKKVYATGGGAYKFENEFKEVRHWRRDRGGGLASPP